MLGIHRREAHARPAEVVSPEKLKGMPLFEHLPYKFLSWNANAVVRRRLDPKPPNNVLFREGEYGSTAYILKSGLRFLEVRSSSWYARTVRSTSLLSRFLGQRALIQASRFAAQNRPHPGRATTFRSEAGVPRTLGAALPRLQPDDRRIIGEASCLNNYPRADTATAVVPSEVLEFRRNLLLGMLRHPLARQQIREQYRRDALEAFLMGVPLFAGLHYNNRIACAQYLGTHTDLLDFKHVQPGQIIFRQGEPADYLCLVRVGFVKVAQYIDGQEIVLDYVGPGGIFGQLGLVAGAAPELAAAAPGGQSAGTRRTTCIALDTVDLVRVREKVFKELIDMNPGLLPQLVDVCRKQSEKYWGDSRRRTDLASYLNSGLQAARQLLVLDLERCTRCDECSKACADSHGGVTRLIREGVRHDKYLVATSCRSCMNPYCMAGCPVDSIHRGIDREIVIEDWCIGCGSCESHCPYDNIRMVTDCVKREDPDHAGRKVAVVERKATTCDLCQGFLEESETPSCVFACPHDAAFRMNGKKFLDLLARSVSGDPHATRQV
jgi:CRP-like cAMP-binding protein/Fe-S-cluster-containing dehydrogenase component